MANIPALDEGKRVSIGVGLGVFKRASAIALGGSIRVSPNSIFRASVGSAAGNTSGGVGAAFSW